MSPPSTSSASSSSTCQRETTSCGACCGLFNLDLGSYAARRELLLERTREFAASTDFTQPETLRSYRLDREAREENIKRFDGETYTCPFLGYLDNSDRRMGCMVHPIQSGNESAQNYSFYGGSICQNYDCPVKDNDESQAYAAMIEANFPHEDQYARLVADGIFYSALEKIPCFEERLEDKNFQEALLFLLEARLCTPASMGMTSFEIKYRYFEVLEEEFLEYTRDCLGKERLREPGLFKAPDLEWAVNILLAKKESPKS